MNIEQVKEILIRYNRGQASPQEKVMLESWYAHESFRQMQNPQEEDYERIRDELFATLSAYPVNTIKVKSFRRVFWLRRIAATVAIVGLGIGFYLMKPVYRQAAKETVTHEYITSGKIGGTLYLSNGQKVKLTESSKEEKIEEEGIIITKSAEGQLIYGNEIGSNTDKYVFNTLKTDRGQTYKLLLPDGSKVWLNAASSLTYTTGLQQDGERKVILEGEAYFEVHKDKIHPFVVQTKDQRVRVLGTHFNIEAYADQSGTRTTLQEGSVHVIETLSGFSKSVILKPGQQALLSKGALQVKDVDAQMVAAWTKGDFIFREEHLPEVMAKLSRWYNVDVEYRKGVPLQTRFNAMLSRSNNLEEILDIIQSTGKVKFEIKNRKIFVSATEN
ncbi:MULTISPECIES: FecR family protein [unclassified Sphingobacterium]|uniref:FecR family protein n=1 Tax=unclassified Sphingobacterium TaxID=2609468 RepID=UPI0025E590C3|nr:MULTISPECIES: FecR family protein [unclassified Sphingobacterium]